MRATKPKSTPPPQTKKRPSDFSAVDRLIGEQVKREDETLLRAVVWWASVTGVLDSIQTTADRFHREAGHGFLNQHTDAGAWGRFTEALQHARNLLAECGVSYFPACFPSPLANPFEEASKS